MKKRILLSIIGTVMLSAASAQTTSVNFDQLATNCQLVVEKNNLKNQKQQELAEITAELENYKQLWWDICYAAIENNSTTNEDLQYLLDNTYSDIDNNQLITDLNKALQGKPVTRQTMPQQPKPDKSPKGVNPNTQTEQEPPVVVDPKKELKDDSGNEPQPEVTEPAKIDPTKKVNDPNKTVKEEKKEEKTTLRPDDLVRKKQRNNNNNNN
jgi:hypothetical protein